MRLYESRLGSKSGSATLGSRDVQLKRLRRYLTSRMVYALRYLAVPFVDMRRHFHFLRQNKVHNVGEVIVES